MAPKSIGARFRHALSSACRGAHEKTDAHAREVFYNPRLLARRVDDCNYDRVRHSAWPFRRVLHKHRFAEGNRSLRASDREWALCDASAFRRPEISRLRGGIQ